MRIPRLFFADCGHLTGEVSLNERNHHYLSHVLRSKTQRTLVFFNGHGYKTQGHIMFISKKETVVFLEKGKYLQDSRLPVTLGLALVKADHFDWALQKATELGVTAIQPLLTKFTDSPPNSHRLTRKVAHWQEILINACEQSENLWLPELLTLKPINQLMLEGCQTVVAHPAVQTAAIDSQYPTLLLIGPEGGFSDAEVDTLLKNEVKPMSLGPRILRTETAAIVGLSLLGQIYGQY